MKILYDNTRSSQHVPKSHTLLLDSQVLPSKLNIKLKTHSLTCLDIPLETCADFKQISSSFRNGHQKPMAGSVDLISEIQQKSNDENFSNVSSSKPLINIVSSNKQQLPSNQQIIKHRFRMPNSFLTSTSLNDSIVRLRRSRNLQNLHQSSLQTIDKINERKHRLFHSHNGPIPKFSFRDLPSYSRKASSIQRYEQASEFRMSPYTSLPEIQSFIKHNSSDNPKLITTNKAKPSPSTISSSWKKSGSWSWKSNDSLQVHSNIVNKKIHSEFDDHYYSNLPVIIESPLPQRSSLQTINQNSYNSPTKLTSIHRSNLSFSNDKIQQNPRRLYQKKTFLPHSISNYEVSSNQLSSQSSTRYPSTPVLAYSRKKITNKTDYHSYGLDMSPMAIFDDHDDEDDDSDSISRHSSFRSCLDSINDFSENNITDLSSSSSSESCFQEMSSNYDFKPEIFNETIKHTSRFSIRHFCNIQ